MKEFLKIVAKFIGGMLTAKKPSPVKNDDCCDKTKETCVKPACKKEYVVLDKVKELPWHETRKWGKRPLSKINKVVVHQSLTTGSLENINKYHTTPGPQNHISSKGAPHICYHYAIDRDANIIKCNPHSSLVWHAKGQNTSGIGVLVCGDFDGPSYNGKDGNPTPEQVDALDYLWTEVLSKELGDVEIYGHYDFGKENCPGSKLEEYVKENKANA